MVLDFLAVEPERDLGVEEQFICLKSKVDVILLKQELFNVDSFGVILGLLKSCRIGFLILSLWLILIVSI